MTENLENTQNSKKQLCLPSFLLYLVFCAWIIEGTSINIYLTEWNEFTRDSHMVFSIKWKLLLLFSHRVMPNSLRPHELQLASLPCPSLSPEVCSNSCPLSRWLHPTILSCVTPFSSCPQSFPASGSFPVNRLFTSSGQSFGTSASASVIPMSIQDWYSSFFFNLFYFLTLQYCIGFAIYQNESITGIHVFPILNPPPSFLPIPSLWVIPVQQPQASSIVHRTGTGDSFHTWYYTCFNAILPNHPTLSLSHRVQKTVLYVSVSFAVSYTGLLLPSF